MFYKATIKELVLSFYFIEKSMTVHLLKLMKVETP